MTKYDVELPSSKYQRRLLKKILRRIYENRIFEKREEKLSPRKEKEMSCQTDVLLT